MTENKAETESFASKVSSQSVVKAIVIGVREDARADMSGKTKQIPDPEQWGRLYTGKLAIEPPFDPLLLGQLAENNSELGQCVEAMEVNIEGFGHRFLPIVDEAKLGKEQKAEMQAERVRLTNFFNTCSGVEESFIGMRRKTRRDIELTGCGYWEAVLSPVNREKVTGLNHMPAHTMRLSPADDSFVPVKEKQLIKNLDGTWEYQETEALRRFRRFCQKRGTSTIWFKTLGDPRELNCETGDFAKEGEKIPVNLQANAVIFFRIYSPRTPYGIPRYIGNLFSIYGSRGAEEINYTTMRNNNIPSMIVSVSNGMLTQPTIDRMSEFVQTQIRGSDNFSKFLILEAESAEEGEGSTGQIQIKVTPLTDSQMHDAYFQTYDKNNNEKVRRSFRLPPIFVGIAEAYNRATAIISKIMGDEQIFAPERSEVDFVINSRILPRLNARWHAFKSNSPNITSNEELVRLLAVAEKTGGISPQIARNIVAEILGRELGIVDAINPDIPFTIQVAEAAKNRGPVNMGTVAAMKAEDLEKLVDGQGLLEGLLAVRKLLMGSSDYGGDIDDE